MPSYFLWDSNSNRGTLQRQSIQNDSCCTTSPWWQALEIGLRITIAIGHFLKYIFCQNHPYFFKSSKSLFLLSRIQILTKDTKPGPGVNQTMLWMMPRAVWLFASCPCFPTSSSLQWRQGTMFFSTVFPAVSLSPSTSLSLRKGQGVAHILSAMAWHAAAPTSDI